MEPEKGLQVEDSVREAYCWYLRSRLKARAHDLGFFFFLDFRAVRPLWPRKRRTRPGAARSRPYGTCGTDSVDALARRSCGSRQVRLRRPGLLVAPFSEARHFQRLQVPRLDGKLVTSRFSRSGS